ncbi:MAG: endonuclease/exonuclease/phosphatase family protein [Candidatus Taylorbacteria bacterium]
MKNEIKLLQLNIESDKHLERIVPFVKENSFDVLCMQEVPESALQIIAEAANAEYAFAGMTLRTKKNVRSKEGIAIFSRFPIKNKTIMRYAGNDEPAVEFDRRSAESKHATQSYSLLACELEKDSKLFRIATTHFTWTPDGMPDSHQRKDMKELLKAISNFDELLLAGDFNAPRGGEIFGMLTEQLKDNVPARFSSSLDKKLHRGGAQLELMVDGIFSSPGYEVHDVEMFCGLSDHCALVGRVSIAT